jgi:hypothetical protein
MTDGARHMVFDSDSFLMALNNCSSGMFTNDKNDLIGTPRKVLKDVLGIGRLQICLKGMVMWPFEDDNGVVHKWQLPAYHSPDIPVRLFSPQRWAQLNSNKNACCVTYLDQITLEWDGHIRTIPLNAANLGFFRSAPGFKRSKQVVMALQAILPEELTCFQAHVIPPDDDDDQQEEFEASLPVNDPRVHAINDISGNEGADSCNSTDQYNSKTTKYNFNFDDPAMVEDDDVKEQDAIYADNPSAALLHWHYRLEHLPFKSLQTMAQKTSSSITCYVQGASLCRMSFWESNQMCLED